MKLKHLLIGGAILTGLAAAPPAMSQEKPEIFTFKLEGGSQIVKMSDSGKWAVAKAAQENAQLDSYPYLLDIEKETYTSLLSQKELETGVPCGAYDVSDDGTIIVGNYEALPAYYKDGKWTKLPLPDIYDPSQISISTATGVSADGKYIVGTLNAYVESDDNDVFISTPLLWENNKLIKCPNLPTVDAGGYDIVQNDFQAISGDGNLILGCYSFSHPGWGAGYYVYNRTTQSYTVISDKELPYKSFYWDAQMSNNGKWVTGMIHYVSGGTFGSEEYKIAFTFDVEKSALTYFNEIDDVDYAGTAISNEGLLLGCTPAEYLARSFNIRVGFYWYDMAQLLKQHYGIDYTSATGFNYSGLPIGISDDGLTVGAMAMNTSDCYFIRMKESFTDAAEGMNLLANYSVSPAAGATFARPKQFSITFDKTIELNADATAALYDASGNLFQKSLGIQKDNNSDRTYYISFRPKETMTAGEKYTLRISAGAFHLQGAPDKKSDEINITYVGRANVPLVPTQITPADNTSVKYIGPNNMIAIQFDAPLSLVEGAKASLYQEDNTTALCDLPLATQSNLLGAYSAARQNLQKDTKYKVVIPAKSITDIMGDGANEEIVLHYTGNYEPALLADTLIFAEDFTDVTAVYNQMMLYDGDQQTPTAEMEELGFTTKDTPWYYQLHDVNETDYCAGSHSNYTNGGASDDWMITKQLYLKGREIKLIFDGQSYRKAKTDKLKVILYESDEAMSQSTLTKAFIDKIAADGKVIYDGIETSGDTEETLADEWTTHTIDLSGYAGKNVYIAFVNQNKGQSIVLVDNIRITTDERLSASLKTATSVVNQNEIEIAGYIANMSKDITFNNLSLTLLDENNEEVDKQELKDQNLTYGKKIDFTFAKQLPLTVGKENVYTVKIVSGEETKMMRSSVKDLAFQPVKRVVIEEATGAGCKFCPLGSIALDHIEKTYPDNIVPICIHSASMGADPYDFSAYLTALGMGVSLPQGRVNRNETAIGPMYSNGTKYAHNGTEDSPTFLDQFLKEMESPADADIEMTSATYDNDILKIKVDVQVKYALDMTDLNVGILFVLMEDGLAGRQANNMASIEDPILGEWGKGGIYGSSTAKVIYKDVARTVYDNVINGTIGRIPTEVTGGEAINFNVELGMGESISNWDKTKLACIMIDTNTGKVINATRKPLTNIASGITNNELADAIEVVAGNDEAIVRFAEAAEGQAALYTVNGTMLDNTLLQVEEGNSVSLSARGYTGIAIVRVISGNQVIIRKIYIK